MQFAKISPRLEIHSRLIRMENTFFCLRDCWSPHDSLGLVSHTSNRLMRSCNCASKGHSAFQLCRCAMRLLPHPRINQSKARIHSNGNSFFCCDECTPWAFLCSCINQSKARNPFPVLSEWKTIQQYGNTFASQRRLPFHDKRTAA